MSASTKANIYREAARLLEIGARHSDNKSNVMYSCCAIAEAEGCFNEWNLNDRDSSLVDEYRTLFDGGFDPFDSGRDHRILALCLMAAMVEAGDA